MKIKTSLVIGCVFNFVLLASAATNELSAALQKGLFEEEANHNFTAAIQAYQSVINQLDEDRKLAATAVFRLGEVYRKQGKTNEAVVQYERIVREFSDQGPLLTLSRQNLGALGASPGTPSRIALSNEAREEQKRLLAEEIKLVETTLATQQKQIEVGIISSAELVPTQRDLLNLRRQLAALEAGLASADLASDVSSAPAAILDGDEIRHIQALIKDSPDLINSADKSGQTLLQTASAKGRLAVVKLLLESGAAIDGIREPELTPLHYAAGNGHKAVVDLLLSRGAKVDARTERGVTPLHLAAVKGYEGVAKTLVNAGAKVNVRVDNGSTWDSDNLKASLQAGQTPFLAAVGAGYPNLVEFLLSKGADINAEDGHGQTALSYAVQRKDEHMVKTLLAANANPNAGRALLPLNLAAWNDEVAMLELLLAKGADPNTNTSVNWGVSTLRGYSPNGGSFSPLYLAVNQHHPASITVLTRHKADPKALEPYKTPLLFTALPNLETLKALLDGGADPNQRDSGGSGSPFALLATGDPATVKLLLEHGANPNVANEQAGTPLFSAAATGNKQTAELLINAGADVNAQRIDNGYTPLHAAVEQTYSELVELLLTNKADPNLRDKNGRTPLDLTKPNPPPPPPGGLAYQWRNPGGVPGMPPPLPMPARGTRPLTTPPTPATAPASSVADLLRQHGAVEDLPRLDRIELRRPAVGFASTPLLKNSQPNQYTLLELIAAHYGVICFDPAVTSSTWTYDGRTGTLESSLRFPDLKHVVIRRATPDGNSRSESLVDLSRILESGGCSLNPPLQWGDIVELPEADHPINATWAGFSPESMATFTNCLKRQVRLSVTGHEQTNLVLQASVSPSQGLGFGGRRPGTPAQFCLFPVLVNSGLLRASSDLSRVKVTRRDPATGQTLDLTFDCSNSGSLPAFWLRDGDAIEVPEKN